MVPPRSERALNPLHVIQVILVVLLAAVLTLVATSGSSEAEVTPTTEVEPLDTQAPFTPTPLPTLAAEILPTLPTDYTPTPAPSDTPAPTPTPQREPIIRTGIGDAVFYPQKWVGPALVRINYPGTGTLVVWSQNANGERQDQLADRIGPYQGDSLIDFEGAQRTLRFEVRTGDAWQIEILPLSAARHAAVPGVIEGSGDDAVVFEGAFLPDLLTVDASGATGEFSVWAYSHLHEQVINSNAPYTGTISIPRDTLALGIKAEGPWRIEVTTR